VDTAKNTVNDFLETVGDLESDITCPSCGSHLAAQMQGSYELTLTPRARNEFNNIITLYRAFLLDLEEQLSNYNLPGVKRNYGYPYPYDTDKDFGAPDGSGLFAKGFADELRRHLKAFDWYERKRLIEELPLLGDNAVFAEKEHEVITNVLLGLEPNLISGPLANIIFGQRHVATWVKEMVGDKWKSNITEILQAVCPTIADYLRRSEEGAKGKEPAAAELPLSEVSSLTRRAELLLILLLGHRADRADDLTLGFMRKEAPYRLPAEVQVPSRFLADVTVAAALLRRDALGLSPDFRKLVSGGRFARSTEVIAENTEMLIAKHGREVAKLVRFACTGEANWLPPEVKGATGSLSAQRYKLEAERRRQWSSLPILQRVEKTTKALEIKEDDSSWSSGQVWYEATRPSHCGWYPKTTPTHNVTLLGSPGVGKSTVMTTGLPAFVRSAFGLGLRIKFEDADDNLMYSAYDELYWRGVLPAPTELGVRHSIEFYAEETGNPTSRTHFVFTDIPGEIVAAGIQAPGTHPIIYNGLRNASTIVFFLDLTLDLDIRQSLTKNKTAAQYEYLPESAKNTREDRGAKGESEDTPKPSKADVSQTALLYQLIEELREIHGEEKLREINMVLVIPKADLFVGGISDADAKAIPRPFLTTFFKSLRDQNILQPSPFSDEPDGARQLSGLRSDITVPANAGNTMLDAEAIRDRFHAALDDISDAAKRSLQEIKEGLAGTDLETIAIGNLFQAGIIQALEEIFTPENVHFFPISASGAGEQGKKIEIDGESAGRPAAATPPNQILSELVFAAPISIALSEQSQE
jgi:hypothetical protein